MRAALSIVLAGLLVTTPLKLVLAQAAKQETATVQQTAPDSSSHRLIRVPPITDRTAPLWRPLRTHDNLADALPDGRTMHLAPLSTFAVPAVSAEEVAAGVAVAIVLILLVAFVIICKKAAVGEDCAQ